MLRLLILLFRTSFKTRSQLALENLALRQQLAVLKREKPRPKLNRIDRILWVFLSRIFAEWNLLPRDPPTPVA